MFTEILNSLRKLVEGMRPWVMIAPWEQGLRVRLGKSIKQLGSGVHLKLPFLDKVYVQSVRLRVCELGKQTVLTADGKVATLSAVAGYSITSIQTLYSTLHHAEDTIRNTVRANLAGMISKLDSKEMSLDKVSEAAIQSIMLDRYGIHVESISVVEFAIAKTYRLIGDYGSYLSGNTLNVEQ